MTVENMFVEEGQNDFKMMMILMKFHRQNMYCQRTNIDKNTRL